MTHETHLNLSAERVQEAIDKAAPGEASKLLISEAHLHSVNEVVVDRTSVNEVVVDRTVYKHEDYSAEAVRMNAMSFAVTIARADYNTKPVEQVLKEASLIEAYLLDGSVPEVAQS